MILFAKLVLCKFSCVQLSSGFGLEYMPSFPGLLYKATIWTIFRMRLENRGPVLPREKRDINRSMLKVKDHKRRGEA